MKINDKYPNLDDLFGAYFNQDWNVDYENAEAVISAFAQDEDIKGIENTINELKILLQEKHTLAGWEKIIHSDFGCAYSLKARNIEPTNWLRKIQKQLEDELILAKKHRKNSNPDLFLYYSRC